MRSFTAEARNSYWSFVVTKGVIGRAEGMHCILGVERHASLGHLERLTPREAPSGLQGDADRA